MIANHSTPAVVLEHSQLVLNIRCADQGLEVDFWTASALEYVQSAWDVNFIAITWSADCGSAPARHHSYWNVTRVIYPESTLTALLDATEIAIEDAIDQIHLIWGTHVPDDPLGSGSGSSDDGSSSASDNTPDADTNSTVSDDDVDVDVDWVDDLGYYDSEGNYYYYNVEDDLDDDDEGYYDFENDFSNALHAFAPGLTTYMEDDFDEDDSPANSTAGDPDYDLEWSGILRRDPAPQNSKNNAKSGTSSSAKGGAAPNTNNVAGKGSTSANPAGAAKGHVGTGNQQVNPAGGTTGGKGPGAPGNSGTSPSINNAGGASPAKPGSGTANSVANGAAGQPGGKAAGGPGTSGPSAAPVAAANGGGAAPEGGRGRSNSVGGFTSAEKKVIENTKNTAMKDRIANQKNVATVKAQTAKQKTEKEQTSFDAAVKKLGNDKTAATKARTDYLNAKAAADANPSDKALAAKMQTAKKTLDEKNKEVTTASKAVQDSANKLKTAKSEESAARIASELTEPKKLLSGAKDLKTDALAIAKAVSKDTLAKINEDKGLFQSIVDKATGIFDFFKKAYDLIQDVKNVVSGSTLKPESTFEIDISPALKNPDQVFDSPWGEQYRITSGGEDKSKYSLYCVDCGIQANIRIAGEVRLNILEGKLDKSTITVEGSNIKAKLFLGLEVDIEETAERTYNIFKAPIHPGFSIPKIITIGPAVRLDARLKMKLYAKGTLLAGAEAGFTDFKATLDLANSKNSGLNGFVPKFDPKFEAFGSIRASTRLGFPLSIGIGIDIPLAKFNKGISIANEPFIKGTASYGVEKSCPKGIDYSVGGGNNIYANLLELTTVTFLTYTAPPLTTGCYP